MTSLKKEETVLLTGQSQVARRVTRKVDISTFLLTPKSGVQSLLSQDSSAHEWSESH